MHRIVLCLGLAALLLPVHVARGQAARSGAGRGAEAPVIRLKQLTGTGRRAMVRTPEYETNVGRTGGASAEWARILVEYESYPEWIDELTFRYTVMALKEDRDGNRYSVYKLSVRYIDIDEDRDHKSTVFLHPNAVRRYGDIVAVAVEVVHEGNVIARLSEEDVKLPEDWWQNSSVLESDKVTVRDGYLLDRSKSPFALINIDEYEVIR